MSAESLEYILCAAVFVCDRMIGVKWQDSIPVGRFLVHTGCQGSIHLATDDGLLAHWLASNECKPDYSDLCSF